MVVLAKPLIFLASTAAKAWEPLSVSAASELHGAGASYLFPTALVACEAIKLAVLLPCNLMYNLEQQPCKVQSGSSLLESARKYGPASAALAICNLCLGNVVPRLGALLYQVSFQVISVLSTAWLSFLLLGEHLSPGQWGGLGLVTAGSLGVVRATTRGSGSVPSDAPLSAFLLCMLGAITFSLSTVLSERASSSAQDAHAKPGVLHQAVCFSTWGIVVNLFALFVVHVRNTAMGAGTSPLMGFLICPSVGPWRVATSIAAADLSMTVFCMIDGLGANAYSVSRAVGMVCTPLLATLTLGIPLSIEFCLASTMVAFGGFVFARCKRGP